MCIIFSNIHKHIHSVSDQQVKYQNITILTDNKTKFRNIEKLRSLSFIYQCFCCCLEIFLIEILRL